MPLSTGLLLLFFAGALLVITVAAAANVQQQQQQNRLDHLHHDHQNHNADSQNYSILWKTPSLTSGHNSTFGTPSLLLDLVAVLAADTITNASTLCVLSAETGELLWSSKTSFIIAASGWVAAGRAANDTPAFFAGTDRSIIAFDAYKGSVLWVHEFPVVQEVPAHPTYQDGMLIYVCENGEDSSPVTALDAATGFVLWTTEDVGFTLVWPTGVGLLVYCGYDLTTHDIGLYARRKDGSIAWSVHGLYSTVLNNNPNLDVGAAGVFMYSKGLNDTRIITLFDTETGVQQWNITDAGGIDDYDTFTWGGAFYRLISLTPITHFMIQSIATDRTVLWTSYFDTTDDNQNILVGGGAVMAVGQLANEIVAFDVGDGKLLWRLPVFQPNDGSISDSGILYFGDGAGFMYAVAIRP